MKRLFLSYQLCEEHTAGTHRLCASDTDSIIQIDSRWTWVNSHGGRCKEECIKTTDMFSDAVMNFLICQVWLRTHNQKPESFFWGVKPEDFLFTFGNYVKPASATLLCCWFKIRSEVKRDLEQNLWVLIMVQAVTINTPADLTTSLLIACWLNLYKSMHVMLLSFSFFC